MERLTRTRCFLAAGGFVVPRPRTSKTHGTFLRSASTRPRSKILVRRESCSASRDAEVLLPDTVLLPYTDDYPRSHPIEQEALFTEDFGHSVYVEKEKQQMNNAVSAAPLRTVEIVSNSPSLSLVSTRKPEKLNQERQIFKEILAIAVPALGTVLADPLMSLVDTACVGQVSAKQLAALGPNTAIFNMVFAMLSVIGAALANRLARNSHRTPGLSKNEKAKRREENETILSHTVILSVGLGAAVTAAFFATGPTLLRLMGTSPSVLKPALDYLLIRSLATPAVLFGAVAQGACLGQQDMWTPMKVVLAAGVVNLVVDIVLISFMGMGTVGAAAATAGAQIAGAIFFFHYLSGGGKNEDAVRLKWKGFPTLSTLKPILDMGRVLCARNFILMLAYTGMTALATSLGTIELAAHQVALQLFWFLGFVPEPLSLTAQSLLARDLDDKKKTRMVSYILMKFGAYAGILLAVMFGSTLMFMPQCFTSDMAIISEFQNLIPHGILSLTLLSISSMFDGISIGSGQYEHLTNIMYAATSATIGFQWVTMRLNLGLNGIWVSLMIFFASRNLLHVAHMIRNWKTTPFSAFSANNPMEPQLATN